MLPYYNNHNYLTYKKTTLMEKFLLYPFKKWQLALLLIALPVFAHSSKTTREQEVIFTLKANLKHLHKTLYISKSPYPKAGEADTVHIVNDKFVYILPAKKYTSTEPWIYLTNGTNFIESYLVVPGEVMTIKGDVRSDVEIGGTKFYKEWGAVNRLLQTIEDDNNEESLILNFMKKNPDNEAAIFLLYQLEQIAPDRIEEAIGIMSDKVRKGRMKELYDDQLTRLRSRIKDKQLQQTLQAGGREVPDFTLNDINGRQLSLFSLRGKYVVLDFWGSWCVWCMKGVPKMKEYYKKYAGKFEILGIDCNETEDKWKQAVKDYQLPWLNVYCTNDSNVKRLFGIKAYPTKIILSPEGKIVMSVEGEDPSFYDKLDELFSK